uniref:DNA 5'-3' helicase n=1 Tax=Osmundea sinicola TaxID=290685 RepID=A0A7L4WNW8_9FLOR|nr:Replication helicase subunit [Osmundea sinicola]QFR99965.1 Replication helicase subunit [Osmundea sinicola]
MVQLYKQKLIPQNYLVEEILLGTIIIFPSLIIHIKNNVTKDLFFLEVHELIYIHLLEHIYDKFNIINFIYILKSKNLLNKIGGLKKLINLMRQSQVFIDTSNINHYLEKLIYILHGNYIKRLIVQYGYNITKIGFISTLNNKYFYNKIRSYLELLEKEININEKQKNSLTSIKKLISIKLLELKHPTIYNKNIDTIKKDHIQFGFKQLDAITNGLPDGNLIIIAGRPSIGKTSFAINIAYNVFFYQKANICVFSLEMSTLEIVNKFLSISCGINFNQENILKLNTQEWKNIILICKQLIQNNIYINDTTNISITYIEKITESLQKRTKIKLIIIDYLQLITFIHSNNESLNRSQELGYITRRLKLLAQLLQLPIIILSQLNRNIENRSNKDPILSDLKESGCVKHNNNIHLFYNYLTIDFHVKNVYFIKNKLSHIRNISPNNQITISKQIIYLSIKNIVCLTLSTYIIEMTYNHKYLSNSLWQQVNTSVQSNKINSLTVTPCNKFIISKKYLKQILFEKSSITYDIVLDRKFYFLSRQIIVHNSIEQDSDIVIMLHNKNEHNDYNKQQTIDIKISKNRNGRTGYCKIKFIPQNVKFNELTVNT